MCTVEGMQELEEWKKRWREQKKMRWKQYEKEKKARHIDWATGTKKVHFPIDHYIKLSTLISEPNEAIMKQ